MTMNKAYWQQRTDEVFDELFSERELRKIYRKSYKSLKKDIEILFLKVRNGEKLTRTELYQYSQFRHLKANIRTETGVITDRLNNHVEKTLTEAYMKEFQNVMYLLKRDKTFELQNKKMLKACLKKKWSGVHYSNRIWGNTKVLAKSIENTVADMLLGGLSTKNEIVKEVMRDFNKAYNVADRLVRTELMHTINTAQIDTYKSEGVKKVEWLAENDSAICDECKALDGKIFSIIDFTSGKIQVIQHPRCRCTVSPVID